jgi:hypothetical protein
LCFTFLFSNAAKNGGVWMSVRFKWWSLHSCLVVAHRVPVVAVVVVVEVEVKTVWSWTAYRILPDFLSKSATRKVDRNTHCTCWLAESRTGSSGYEL